jgi:hypothetical protein
MGKRRRRKIENIKNRINLKGNFCCFVWEGEIEGNKSRRGKKKTIQNKKNKMGKEEEGKPRI